VRRAFQFPVNNAHPFMQHFLNFVLDPQKHGEFLETSFLHAAWVVLNAHVPYFAVKPP
jgi:hypothetical protein